MHRKHWIFLFFIAFFIDAQGQELQARFSIIAAKVSTTTDRKVFQTLQTRLTNFLNNRRWTNDVFQPNEKIQCSFLLTIEQDLGNNIYKGRYDYGRRPFWNIDLWIW